MTGANADTMRSLKPSPDQVMEQLDRILSSRDFDLPQRARRFLQFIIEETLDGRGGYLKAFTIAQVVFGRDASFDAQSDPCVRVEASRIRRELERYYLLEGSQDDVVITIPKGTYVPSFRMREVSDGQATAPAQKPPPMPMDATFYAQCRRRASGVVAMAGDRSDHRGFRPGSGMGLAGRTEPGYHDDNTIDPRRTI
ncbi:hypothetical protein LZK76_33645 (plasmid) [Rhizobium leguminosarum]|nr:hypothetical protein LZK76_33645 [Rhizobium leguminosarum]